MIGSRDSTKLSGWLRHAGRGAQVGTFPDTAQFGYVVKGLNVVQADVMINPSLTGDEPDMFIAGNHDAAKQAVTELLAEFGWPVIDMGGIESARWLEALSLAWVVYSHRTGKTHHAFKLVGK
jgi:8-hydroxy-5-deazaflavin:NADPH oxidoreductase